jgi:hypothetical protein
VLTQVQSSQSFVEKICQTIDETAFARVMVEDWDLLSHGDWIFIAARTLSEALASVCNPTTVRGYALSVNFYHYLTRDF